MGTAGPLALAKELLDDGSGQPFFVLNRCEQQRATRHNDAKLLLAAKVQQQRAALRFRRPRCRYLPGVSAALSSCLF
jgi:hypothetical protein